MAKSLKKILVVLFSTFALYGSGGQPAIEKDSTQSAKPIAETVLTQPQDSKLQTNPLLDVIAPHKGIQDIILGYIRGHDVPLFPTFHKPKDMLEAILQVQDFACSPDGKYLAVIRSGRHRVQFVIYDSNFAPEKIDEWNGHIKAMRLRYSQDGKYLATYGKKIIIMWDAHTRKKLKEIETPRSLNDMVFMKNSDHLLVSLGVPSTVASCEWNIEDPKFCIPHNAPTMNIHALALSPDGNHIAQALVQYDSVNNSWVPLFLVANLLNGKIMACQKVINWRKEGVIAYSPSGSYFAAVSPTVSANLPTYIKIYDTNEYKLLTEINGPSSECIFLGLAFSPDDKYLAFATTCQLSIYDIKDKKELFTYTFQPECIGALRLAYHPTEPYIYVLLDDRISIFDAPGSIGFGDVKDRVRVVAEQIEIPQTCSHCRKSSSYCTDQFGVCSLCKKSWYCSDSCLKADWPKHQLACVEALNKSSQVSTTK